MVNTDWREAPAGSRALHTALEIELQTGIARRTAVALLQAGAVPSYFHSGSGLFVDDDGLATLRSWQDVHDFVPALNVKVAPARLRDHDDPSQGEMGWRTGMSLREAEVAVGRWWYVADAERLVADQAALLVTIGGVVVFVAKIVDVSTDPDTAKRAFNLDAATAQQQAAYERRKLPPQRGPMVRWLGYPDK